MLLILFGSLVASRPTEATVVGACTPVNGTAMYIHGGTKVMALYKFTIIFINSVPCRLYIDSCKTNAQYTTINMDRLLKNAK